MLRVHVVCIRSEVCREQQARLERLEQGSRAAGLLNLAEPAFKRGSPPAFLAARVRIAGSQAHDSSPPVQTQVTQPAIPVMNLTAVSPFNSVLSAAPEKPDLSGLYFGNYFFSNSANSIALRQSSRQFFEPGKLFSVSATKALEVRSLRKALQRLHRKALSALW